MRAIDRAVHICGGQENLARAVGVSQARVSQWAKGEPIAIRHFPRIKRATSGEVTEQHLLDDELAKLSEDAG